MAQSNVVELKKLLKTCKKVDVRHVLGGFPLHTAAKQNRRDIVTVLLNHSGTEVNCRNREGCTSLWLTCDLPNPDLSIAAAMLAHGADPNVPNYQAVSPLHLACKRANLELVKLLLDHQADVNSRDCGGSSPLLYAIQLDTSAIVRHLLAHGASIQQAQAGGFNAIMVAVHRRLRHVDLLLAHAPSLNEETADGRSALMLAMESSYVDAVRALLNRGAAVTACTLAVAVKCRDYAMFELAWQHTEPHTVTEAFMKLVCRHCPLGHCYKRYTLIMGTQAEHVRLAGVSGLLCPLLRGAGSFKLPATEHRLLEVLGWLLDRGVRLGARDVKQVLWSFARRPAVLHVWTLVFARTTPNVTQATVLLAMHYAAYDVALLFVTYCLHLQPFEPFRCNVPDTFWRAWLALFTPTGHHWQLLANRLGAGLVGASHQVPSLLELARDAVRRAMQAKCSTSQHFLAGLEVLQVPTALEDVLRLRVPVNRHSLAAQ